MPIIKYLNLSRVVEPSTRINKTENRMKSECNGILKFFVLSFPSGCDNLLGISCGVRQQHILPVNNEVRMTEASIVFPVNIPVCVGDYIWAEIVNYSSTNKYRAEIYAGIECECNDEEGW